MKKNRRSFLKQSSIAALGIGLQPYFPSTKMVNASDKLKVGVIGCNGMGWANMRTHLLMPEIDCIGICDVDKQVLEARKADYSKMRDNKPTLYTDYRKLLDNKEIDAVIIGTPDHWHCKMMVDAMDAGKHVYVEKPIANTVEECKLMVKAAKHYGKIVQVGQWQRSGPHYAKAIEIVQSGKLGNIRLVKCWAYQGWCKALPNRADGSVPAGVDYKSWLGPAPMRPFNPNRFHFNFRWYWDYAGGLMTDWGVHELDIALYAMKATAPKSVMATGGKLAYPNDPTETPDTLQTVFEYDDFTLLWEHATGIDDGPYSRREGIAFLGNNGTLVVNRDGFEVFPQREPLGYSEWGEPRMEAIEKFDRPQGVNYLALHTQNFVQAIKDNNSSILKTPIDSGSIAAINSQMGNISYKRGKKLYWNQAKGKFKGDKKANKLLKARYHNGIKLPKV